jgi:hypothetical protein
MSSILIRAALETGLNAMTPALATAWENAAFTPTTAAYQSVALLFAAPDNISYGAGFTEQGIMQVDLSYPQETGPAAAYTRAELIRSTFARGETFSSGGVSVIIQRTPEILPGRNEGSRYILPVRVRFFAHLF